jgi:D-tagatose-1,6-bisphosphate aldolase subunit GatZ/KbaZ
LSDRIRYYWTHPVVERAFEKMMMELDQNPLSMTLGKQLTPDVYTLIGEASTVAGQILLAKVQNVLNDYADACNMVS